jgi:hypothetical protein
MKNKPATELRSDDLVNQQTISINENWHSMAATNMPAGTAVRVQAGKD